MQETKKSLIIIIIAILAFASLIYLVQQKKIWQKKKLKEELIAPTESPVPKVVAPENAGAGKTGETEKTFKGEERVVLPPETGGPPQVLPPAIFNESGVIKEIKKDSLIILGTGYNFADQKPRELTLKFTASTITNSQDRTKKWIGLEGLKNLKVGDKIIFESPENIRGKTEFEVSYVNKL